MNALRRGFAAFLLAGIGASLALSPAQQQALFHPDPRHVSNRLYRQLHVRTVADGKEYGFDELDPLLWSETNYLLTGKSRARALNLLDEFVRTHAEQQVAGPLRRAILQRDLWAVFDWADAPDSPHPGERAELMARLAAVTRRLALPADQLAALPDTYAEALRRNEFPPRYDPGNPNDAFLPPDLFDADGPWLCLGAPGDGLAAPLHDVSFTARSVFFVFARLPGGREATLEYFKRLADMQIPLFVKTPNPGWPQPIEVWNPEIPQFPAETEFALVRKMLLPDQEGNLQLTPVVESVQIRHYNGIPQVNPTASRDLNLAQRFQSPSEIKLSRVRLFAGGRSGLRGVTVNDDPFLVFPAMSHGFDLFEARRMSMRHFSPFVQCTVCHAGIGVQSMMSFSLREHPNEKALHSPGLRETTPREEAAKVMEWARKQAKWNDLLPLWASASSH